METIFDYATEEELRKHFFFSKIPSKEEYIQKTTPRRRIFDLYALGVWRMDKEFAKKYFDMLPEDSIGKYTILYRDRFWDYEEMKMWEELVDYLTGGKVHLVV
ncbi:MAG: hypothetical protein ACK4VK_08400, partial [Aquificaceae bacterium]